MIRDATIAANIVVATIFNLSVSEEPATLFGAAQRDVTNPTDASPTHPAAYLQSFAAKIKMRFSGSCVRPYNPVSSDLSTYA